ncbi:MAG: hypothetical protein K6G08_06225 [Prevotella sp.]|nr:hypothetical protein [Prevotella sp.]
MKKPRPFYHSPIYSSERSDRLKEAEQHARRELGLDPPPPFRHEDIRGLFSGVRRHKRGSGWLWSLPMLLSLIVIFAATLLLLLAH